MPTEANYSGTELGCAFFQSKLALCFIQVMATPVAASRITDYTRFLSKRAKLRKPSPIRALQPLVGLPGMVRSLYQRLFAYLLDFMVLTFALYRSHLDLVCPTPRSSRFLACKSP